MTSIDVVLKRLEAPDETRILTKGKFEIVKLGGMTIGRATYERGDSPYVSLHFLGADHYAK